MGQYLWVNGFTYGLNLSRTNDTIGGIISQKVGLMSFRNKNILEYWRRTHLGQNHLQRAGHHLVDCHYCNAILLNVVAPVRDLQRVAEPAKVQLFQISIFNFNNFTSQNHQFHKTFFVVNFHKNSANTSFVQLARMAFVRRMRKRFKVLNALAYLCQKRLITFGTGPVKRALFYFCDMWGQRHKDILRS